MNKTIYIHMEFKKMIGWFFNDSFWDCIADQ